jgi:hypothetical protein
VVGCGRHGSSCIGSDVWGVGVAGFRLVGARLGQHPQQLGRLELGERAGAHADQLLVAELPRGRGLDPPAVIQHQLSARFDRRAGHQRPDPQPGALGQDRRQPPRLLQRDTIGDQDQRRQRIIRVLAPVAGEVGEVLGLQQPGPLHQLGLHHMQGAGQAGRPPQPREPDGTGDELVADQQHLHRSWPAGGHQPDQRGAGQPVGARSQDPDGAVAGHIHGDLPAGLLADGHPRRGGVAGIPGRRRHPRGRRRILLGGRIGVRGLGGAGGGKGQQPGRVTHRPASRPPRCGGGWPQRPPPPAAA